VNPRSCINVGTLEDLSVADSSPGSNFKPALADHNEALTRLFVDDFLGSVQPGPNPRPITIGNLTHNGPQPRPSWWPANALGWRISPELQELRYPPGTPNAVVLNATLHRGRAEFNGTPVGWPPTQASIDDLIAMGAQAPGEHPLWYFWDALEQGWRTHNGAHNYIGGHMGGALSPNDPIFWLHHTNVDRIWHLWQQDRLTQTPGSTLADHYPPAQTPSPWDGRPAPLGHYLDDLMWPWVGNVPGYATTDATLTPLLPDFSTIPTRLVRDVLDITALGYSYA
jgi:tyrosinase